MALLTLIHQRRVIAQAKALAADGRTTDAIALLDDADGYAAETLRAQLRAAAVTRWCDGAERAAARGDSALAHERLQRARRYADAADPRLRRVADALRLADVRATRPEHWVALVDAAADARPTAAWGTFAALGLLRAAAATLGRADLGPDAVADLDDDALRALRPLITAHYADLPPLAPPDPPLIAAALHLAAGRPDRAALPLAACDDRDPIVSFELARVAHLLGRPDLAVTALRGLAARAGGHRRIRRLHTAVFLAQMQLAAGDPTGACLTLDQTPVRALGGRPALMYARLLVDRGDAQRAAALLAELLEHSPDLSGAAELLVEARAAASST